MCPSADCNFRTWPLVKAADSQWKPKACRSICCLVGSWPLPGHGSAPTVTLRAACTEAADASGFPQELPECDCPASDLPERSPEPSEQLSFAQEVTATSILRIWTQNDLCFKPRKFPVPPISAQADVLEIPSLAQWWCLGAAWLSRGGVLPKQLLRYFSPTKGWVMVAVTFATSHYILGYEHDQRELPWPSWDHVLLSNTFAVRLYPKPK